MATPKIPMPKPGRKVSWTDPSSSGGSYKKRPMNPDSGPDESAASNFGADADKTFDKGRGSGTSGQETWSDTYKKLKSGKYLE